SHRAHACSGIYSGGVSSFHEVSSAKAVSSFLPPILSLPTALPRPAPFLLPRPRPQPPPPPAPLLVQPLLPAPLHRPSPSLLVPSCSDEAGIQGPSPDPWWGGGGPCSGGTPWPRRLPLCGGAGARHGRGARPSS